MEEALVIVFLGNPGREYAATRHNIGWMAAEYLERSLAQQSGSIGLVPPGPISWNEKFEGNLASVSLKGRKVHLFKPATFMNLSGQPVRRLLDFFKLDIQSVIAVHDELELPFGQLAFRSGGGAGGHNGLRSLDSQSGGPAYQRCRIGIGRPIHGSVADFVLSRFAPDEEAVLPLVLEKTAEQLLAVMAGFKAPAGKIQAVQEASGKR
jgi:PTH1 family peptidyl-tRNA hydrolase